jgi:hypothetical protein
LVSFPATRTSYPSFPLPNIHVPQALQPTGGRDVLSRVRCSFTVWEEPGPGLPPHVIALHCGCCSRPQGDQRFRGIA